jgi:hypothetical protein
MNNNNYLTTASYVMPFNNNNYATTASYVNSGGYQSYVKTPISGDFYKSYKDDGVIHYVYFGDEGENNILDEIEKEGYLILEEGGGEDSDSCWYDVIKPEDMEKNVDNFDHEKQLVEMGLTKETLDIPMKPTSWLRKIMTSVI